MPNLYQTASYPQLFSHFKKSAPCSFQGYWVGDYGSELQIAGLAGPSTAILFGPWDVFTTGGTYTMTRNASGNYSLAKTAGAATSYVNADLTLPTKLLAGSGFKLTKVDFIYSIGTANLTSLTATLQSTTYANNAAVVVAAFGGGFSASGALTATTQAQPYLQTLSVVTPAFSVTADVKIDIELAVVDPGTSVFNFYGMQMYYTNII